MEGKRTHPDEQVIRFIRAKAGDYYGYLKQKGLLDINEFKDIEQDLVIKWYECRDKYPNASEKEFKCIFHTSIDNWHKDQIKAQMRRLNPVSAGRPSAKIDFNEFYNLYTQKNEDGKFSFTLKEIAETLGIGRKTLYNYIKKCKLNR